MRNALYLLIFILFTAVSVAAQSPTNTTPEIIKVEAKPTRGFTYPYYLYIPKVMREPASMKQNHTIVVVPTNSGKLSDDFAVHEADVKRKIKQNAPIADRIPAALLMPVFPRPETDWRIYTHALDRDSMLTSKKDLSRFDLQLVAMIDDARDVFAKQKIRFDERVFMLGFSASGMFANRFTFLHPKRVKAAVVGSPGGWPIAPVASFKDKDLSYPIGIDDVRLVAGKKFEVKNLRKVPMFMFMGAEDENDSVIFRDSYEKQDEELIFALFGKTPVERWEISKQLYQEGKLNAEFKLYPKIKHEVTKEMMEDILAFFAKHKDKK